jgi:hypothetical protein
VQLLCVIVIGMIGLLSTPTEVLAAPMLCSGCIQQCPSDMLSFCAERHCDTGYATCYDIGHCVPGQSEPPEWGRSYFNCYAV